jgi:hypothetical protein
MPNFNLVAAKFLFVRGSETTGADKSEVPQGFLGFAGLRERKFWRAEVCGIVF